MAIQWPGLDRDLYRLDNSWHHGWETVAALIATTKATTR